MATVIITIKDEGEGIGMDIESDPTFPGPAAKDQTMTNAQRLGLIALEAVGEACGETE